MQGRFMRPFAAEAGKAVKDDHMSFHLDWVSEARMTGTCLWWEVGPWKSFLMVMSRACQG